MGDYQPELGQIFFEQPYQQHEASNLLQAAVDRVAREWKRCIGNRTRQIAREYSPFDTEATFSTDGLEINGYRLEGDTQPWNLKCGDVEISWYKHSRRGLSVNKEMTNDEIASFLEDVLSKIIACDIPLLINEDEKSKTFTYCGTVYNE